LGETVHESPRRVKKLAWILSTLLLLLAMIAGGAALYTTHAASPSPLTGRYDLRAVTTSGPQNGLYIRGALALTVSTSGNISGIACGMSYAPSRCLSVTGKTPDQVNVSLTIRNSQSPKFPAVSFSGTFKQSTGAKGSFTGFTGTFTFGKGASISTGHWEGISGPVPPTSGSWNFYMVVQAGHDKGTTYNGVLNLVQDTNDNATIGTYTLTGGTATPVNGLNQNGFVLLNLGKPATFVLKGTFTTPDKGYTARMDGQFYMPNIGTGTQNDRGYWVANQ
jgi:hypothetical protein